MLTFKQILDNYEQKYNQEFILNNHNKFTSTQIARLLGVKFGLVLKIIKLNKIKASHREYVADNSKSRLRYYNEDQVVEIANCIELYRVKNEVH